jgi:hypothetical protein
MFTGKCKSKEGINVWESVGQEAQNGVQWAWKWEKPLSQIVCFDLLRYFRSVPHTLRPNSTGSFLSPDTA